MPRWLLREWLTVDTPHDEKTKIPLARVKLGFSTSNEMIKLRATGVYDSHEFVFTTLTKKKKT